MTSLAIEFRLPDNYTPALPVWLYVLELEIGPLLVGPLSEIHKRRIVYITCFAAFTVLNIGCTLSPNIPALVFLRLLSSMAESAGPSLGSSSIRDIFTQKERGRA